MSRFAKASDHQDSAVFGILILSRGGSEGSSTVVAKKTVDFADSVRFNRQYPVGRSGKATRRGAFEVQSPQTISAAYYFDLTARDYSLADGAIQLVVEGVPCSAFIEPSQSCELIFCDRSDRLRGRKHAGDGGKSRRDLQEQSGRAIKGESVSRRGWFICRSKHGGGRNAPSDCLGKCTPNERRFGGDYKLRLSLRGRNSYCSSTFRCSFRNSLSNIASPLRSARCRSLRSYRAPPGRGLLRLLSSAIKPN